MAWTVPGSTRTDLPGVLIFSTKPRAIHFHLTAPVPGSSLSAGARRWILIGLAFITFLLFAFFILVPRFVFSRTRVSRGLGDATSSRVEFRNFRHVYFPRPGCVAEGVTFRRNGGESGPPLIAATKLTLLGSFLGLFRKHVALLQADGLRITVGQNSGGWPQSRDDSHTVIDRISARDAVLEFTSSGTKPLQFAVKDFSIGGVGGSSPMSFEADVITPLPPGDVAARGKLGPWQKRSRTQIPIAGTYSFRRADLSVFSGIAGSLSSDGRFGGTLGRIDVEGKTETPNFEVTNSGHRFPLSTQFQATVDGTNGDVRLDRVEARTDKTVFLVQGGVTRRPPETRRLTSLDVRIPDGRIEDIFYPFIKAPQSPIAGPVNLLAHVELNSGRERFLDRVSLHADFGINRSRFTDPRTQQKVNSISERARGNTQDDGSQNVVSDLSGEVDLNKAVARFSRLSFAVPGAVTQLHGTYNLINQRINLRGIAHIQAKISDATTGFKSVLLKVLHPFIKKDHPQAPLPVFITGTYEHPVYSVSLSAKKTVQARQ